MTMNILFPIQVPDYSNRDFEHQNVNEEAYASYVNDIEQLNTEAQKQIDIYNIATEKVRSKNVPEQTKQAYRKQREKAEVKIQILVKQASIYSLALELLSIENE